MKGSPPRMPKKLLPCFFALRISLSICSKVIICAGLSTSTQQP
jgi:hypothetical protein